MILLVLFAFATAVSAFLFYRWQRDSVMHQEQQKLLAIHESISAQLHTWRENQLGEAREWMTVLHFREILARWLEQRDPALKQSMMARLFALQERYHYRNIRIVDTTGRILLNLDAGAETDIHADARDSLSVALQRGVPVITDLHVMDTLLPPHLDVVTPLVWPGEHGPRHMAAIILSVGAETSLYPILDAYPVPTRTGECLLFRRDGNDILYLNNSRILNAGAMRLRVPISRRDMIAVRAVYGKYGLQTGKDYRNQDVLSIVRPVSGTTWYLAVEIDEEEAMASSGAPVNFLLLALFSIIAMGFIAFGFLTQRSQRKHYENLYFSQMKLVESEERYRALFSNMLDAFALHEMVLDDRGIAVDYIFLSVNPAFEKQTGLRSEQIIGKRVSETLVGLDPAWIERYARVALLGEELEFIDYAAPLDKYYEVHAFRSSPGRFAASFRDITDRVRSVQQLRESEDRLRRAVEEVKHLNDSLEQRVMERTQELVEVNRDLESFTYSVSHDLRAPLRAIDGFARIIEEDHSDRLDVEGSRLLSVVRNEAVRMGQLIDDLLAFSRLGKQGLRCRSTDVHALVRSVCDDLMRDIGSRTVEISCAPLPPAPVDATLFRQVWVNLIGNALKFTQERDVARVEINGVVEDGWARYTISDNGVGFDMHYADRLFGVFQRLHSLHEYQGTGVGLAIVRRIVQRHGGTISAYAEEGSGATFTLQMPLQPHDAQAAQM